MDLMGRCFDRISFPKVIWESEARNYRGPCRTWESLARVTEGHSAKIPATRRRTRSDGRDRRRLPLLGMRSRRSSKCDPAATWIASTSVPRSSTAEAGASWSAGSRGRGEVRLQRHGWVKVRYGTALCAELQLVCRTYLAFLQETRVTIIFARWCPETEEVKS